MIHRALFVGENRTVEMGGRSDTWPADHQIDAPKTDVCVAPSVTAAAGLPRACSLVMRCRSSFRLSFSSYNSATRSGRTSHPLKNRGGFLTSAGSEHYRGGADRGGVFTWATYLAKRGVDLLEKDLTRCQDLVVTYPCPSPCSPHVRCRLPHPRDAGPGLRPPPLQP